MSQGTTTSGSPLEKFKDEILDWVESGYSNADIVNFLKEEGVQTSDTSIRRALKRWGINRISIPPKAVTYEGDKAEITTQAKGDGPIDHEDALRDRGLNPEEWEVERLRITDWDSPTGDKLRALKLTVRRLTPLNMLIPARVPSDYIRRIKPRKKDTLKPRLVVFVGDQQAPFQDIKLHNLFCQWLEDWLPGEGVLLGDGMDLPDISRHEDNPEWAARTQPCVDEFHLILREYVQSSEETEWTLLEGNHDARIRSSLIKFNPDFYRLRRAGSDEYGVMEVPHLLRLDELGIKYQRANGKWDHGQVIVSPYLAARHGWIATRGSGTSALKTLARLGYSVVVGHTHRQAVVYETVHDIHGNPTVLTAVEAGCMCQVKDGLGHTIHPDWQNGFATATVWPDGTFKIDTAIYVNETLLYRDKRYV